MRIALAVLVFFTAAPINAQAPRAGAARNVIEVSLGGSTVIRSGGGKVTLTDPSVADISAAGAGLLVIGRKVGETNLIMYGGGRTATYLIKVTLPAQAIQSELASLFPKEDISAKAVGGALVLTGVVSAAPVVTQAEELALGYLRSPSIQALGVLPSVINLLRVRDRQQVQLEVKFAEVNRRSAREIGVNAIGGLESGRAGVAVGRASMFDVDPRPFPPPTPQGTVVGAPEQTFSPSASAAGSIFVGLKDGKFPFAATLNLLAESNLARTLAEPTLVAMSGQSASFLAGGEAPIPVSTGLGNPNIRFKKFGIQLEFSPTVLDKSTIQLTTKMAVSAPDFTLSATLGNITTPGFKTRSSSTVVRLRDGQSFVIAGLLNDEMDNIVRKVPGLGDIPILGTLFSSKAYERRETELVIVITARLVDPLDSADLPPLPGQDRNMDPTDLELFLLNIQEATKKRPGTQMGPMSQGPQRKPSGAFGFWR